MDAKIILMADNLPQFVEARKEFLEKAGFTVISACNPTDADRILQRGGIDLAIMDVRLTDDNDEGDISGLELAQKYGSRVPIIMLTGYPTWETVKVALGKDLNGLSPAVDFLSKEEGPRLMLETVKLTIENPELKKLLQAEFKTESTQNFREVLQKKEPADAADKFQKVLDRIQKDLLRHRREISSQSERYQKLAIWMALIGMFVIIIGVLLVFLQIIPLAVLSGVASVVAEAVGVLFIRRAVQTDKKVDQNYDELQKLYRASHLISICDTIESKPKREDTKVNIIEKLLGKWFQ